MAVCMRKVQAVCDGGACVHRAQRSYLSWKIKRKFYCQTKESPLFTVKSVMNLTFQIFM